MSEYHFLSRPLAYYKRHGLRATLGRTATFLRRVVSGNRMVLLYSDLDRSCRLGTLPDQLKVERKTSWEEIAAPDWQQITSFWNPEICLRNFSERFHAGASLWLVRCEGKLAGYGWTLTGRTIAPHYYPLSANDVHMFDFLIFPEFRGQRINPLLVEYILDQLAAEGRTRAYIEFKEWNQSQLASLRKTRFHLLGVARKTSLFGRTLVEWTRHQDGARSDEAQSSARKAEAEKRAGLVSR